MTSHLVLSHQVRSTIGLTLIKGLLAVPFVLHSQPTTIYTDTRPSSPTSSSSPPQPPPITNTPTHRRYHEIFTDVERLILAHILHQTASSLVAPHRSQLKLLVPTVGHFFTPLPLADAFTHQDQQRQISARRFVAPSFNDVRLILNSAQIIGLARAHPGQNLGLVTFDGDVTLYADGGSLQEGDAVIARILRLLRRGTRVGIVTAAGYTEATRYEARLWGLLAAVAADTTMQPDDKEGLVVMGGESNYLFRFRCSTIADNAKPPDDDESAGRFLVPVPTTHWAPPEMHAWRAEDVQALLDVAESALRSCLMRMRLPATILRKHRAVGIIPLPGCVLSREQLEETVLTAQAVLDSRPASDTRSTPPPIPFCAFNGGSDVFVDVGDKSLGVKACQRFFGGLDGDRTLHIGDQFLSGGGNDFKARLVCATAWIAGPEETVGVLDEIDLHFGTTQ